MPRKPLHPCSTPGCPTLTAGRFCVAHHAESARRQDQIRGTAAQRGYGAFHRRWRAAVLANDPVCVACLAAGVETLATVADHIVPLRLGGGWEPENGQGLCETHHQQKSGKEAHEKR